MALLTKAILLAVIHIESSGNPSAISSAGARGLMQLTDIGAQEVCQQYGCEPDFDLHDPETNLRMGTQLLGYYLTEARGDSIGMIVLYNGGYAAYMKYLRKEPLPEETQQYIVKFKKLRRHYATLFSRIPDQVPAYYDSVDALLSDNLFDVSLLGQLPSY